MYLITAYSPHTQKRVNLYFNSLSEAKTFNPCLKHLSIIKSLSVKELNELNSHSKTPLKTTETHQKSIFSFL